MVRLRRVRSAQPTMPKPMIILAQVAGSGTAATLNASSAVATLEGRP